MTNNAALPAGFEELAALADRWARPTEHQRNAVRWNASAQDFSEFYDAMMPRLNDVLNALKACSLDGMSEAEVNLFNLAAAFAEASPHHELYDGSSQVPHSFSAQRFVPGHGDRLTTEIQFR